jgi:hypothetical protein
MTIQQSRTPLFAPLPLPFVEHLVQRLQRRDKKLSPEAAWDRVQVELQQKRGIAYQYMNPFVQMYLQGGVKGSTTSFSTAWMLATLSRNSPEKKPVPDDNLAYWQGKGLLRYREHGIPEPSNAAAFYIARTLVPDQRKGFLPSSMESLEPDWWCWQQSSPDQEPIPCPIPLPTDLPSETVLWTPWAGAAWDASWLLVGLDRGAIRFAGTSRSRVNGAIRWQVQPDALARWEPKLVCLLDELPDEYADPIERQEQLHSLATATLRRLAQTRISSTSFW